MKLFFDEDMGTGIPRALALVRAPVDSIVFPTTMPGAQITKGAADLDWIHWAATTGHLALSQNQRMLRDPAERAAIEANRLGIVFVGTGRAPAWRVLTLLLRRWAWLEQLDTNISRPFAYRVALSGAAEQFDLSSGAWTRVLVGR